MKAKAIFAAAALLAVGWPAHVARADFILLGNDHLDVTTSHTTGRMYDESTADVLTGGDVTSAYVYNLAVMFVRQGGFISEGIVYDDARVAVAGGSVSTLRAHNAGTVELLDGNAANLIADNASSVAVSGGNVSINLYVQDDCRVDLSGGSVARLDLYHHSHLEQLDGSVTALYVHDDCTARLSGGSVGALYAPGGYSITIHGYDFAAAAGLGLVELDVIDGVPQYEVIGTGVLSGRWQDGTTWSMAIPQHDAGVTILAIPEPATLFVIMAAGLPVLLKRRRRRS